MCLRSVDRSAALGLAQWARGPSARHASRTRRTPGELRSPGCAMSDTGPCGSRVRGDHRIAGTRQTTRVAVGSGPGRGGVSRRGTARGCYQAPCDPAFECDGHRLRTVGIPKRAAPSGGRCGAGCVSRSLAAGTGRVCLGRREFAQWPRQSLNPSTCSSGWSALGRGAWRLGGVVETRGSVVGRSWACERGGFGVVWGVAVPGERVGEDSP